jgi:hypothetical protein
MARLNIGGRQVTVDDSFLSLPPDQQNATVDEIAKSLGPEFSANAPGTGIMDEMQRTATDHGNTINQGLLNNPQKSAIGGLLDTGKGLLSAAAVIPDTLIGAPFRSVAGRGLTAASHEAGKVINPEVAAKDDPRQMYEDFRPGVDQALAGMAPRAASPVGARNIPAPTPTPVQAKQSAVDVWERPDIKGKQIPPETMTDLSNQLQNDLVRRGFRDTAQSAGGTLAEVRDMAPKGPKQPSQFERLQAEMNWENPVPQGGVTSVNVDDILSSRRSLGHIAGQKDVRGKATPDAKASTDSMRVVDELLDSISPELRSANANYARGSVAEALDTRAMKAKYRADKKGTGGLETLMRDEVDKISRGGLTAEQKSQMDRIVTGSKTRNFLRGVGKAGVGDKLSLMLHGLAAGSSGGASIPISVTGTLARKLGETLTKREIGSLKKALLESTPLAQSLQPLPPKQASKLTKSLISALMAGSPARQQSMMGLVPARAKDDER